MSAAKKKAAPKKSAPAKKPAAKKAPAKKAAPSNKAAAKKAPAKKTSAKKIAAPSPVNIMAADAEFKPNKALTAEVAELITHYPDKRSASLMVLHAIQAEFGWVSRDAIEWAAKKLDLQPINVYELVTFYPMFNEQPVGRYHIKVCRTLSCALGGSHKLHGHICKALKVKGDSHGPLSTKDGNFTIEWSECLASCGTAPVMMVNDDFYEDVSSDDADEILEKCK